MLVTFHSKDHAPIMMFGGPALELLQLMGVNSKVPGAIYADDVPQALWQLQEGLANLVEAPVQQEAAEPQVSLKLRAVPLLAMLKAAVKGNHPVHWD